MRIVFAGTPEVALPALEALIASHHEVVAVLTRPDAPAGRGRALAASPVAQRAARDGIEVLRPAKPDEPEFLARLTELAPDCVPVVAYGALVPPVALEIPRHGWVNLHFSLLPAWRGAAPVQHAILHGDEVTGASTFRIEAGLDTGPVFGVVTEQVRTSDTSGALLGRLADSGARLLLATLDGLEDGSVTAVPQPADGVSRAPKLTAADARLDWAATALRVDRLIRACTPAPGPWTTFRDRRVKLGPVRALEHSTLRPGELVVEHSSAVAGAGRHRHGRRRPFHGSARRQVRHGRRRVGPWRTSRCRRVLRVSESRPTHSTGANPNKPRKPRPQERKPRPDKARLTAYDALKAVVERDAYANLVLPPLLRERNLSTRDAALATELVYGTLRGQGTYDAILATCVSRPLADVDPNVLTLLRLGAHQLLATRIPVHAAVSATVELARAVAGDSRGTFVNAVLRKVSTHDLDTWIAQVAPDEVADPVGYLAIAHSHPRWIVSALRDALGGKVDQLAELLVADNVRPTVTLVARPGRSELAELEAAGAVRGRFSPYAAVLPDGDPGGVLAVREGRAGVQDEGSQLVALALANAPLEGDDLNWLDLAAGPGGKAALLGAIARTRGARLLAVERQPHRAKLVRDAARSTAMVVTADGTQLPVRAGSFDRVLVDVPCSGLGSLRRRPESRWRRQPGDVPALRPLQRGLLEAALQAVRPGGIVAYVTCSPHLAETHLVVGDARRAHPEVTQVDARELLPGVPDLGAGPHVQLWPHLHGTDAMFLALLRKS